MPDDESPPTPATTTKIKPFRPISPKVLGPAVVYMWVPDAAVALNYYVGMPQDVAMSLANLLAVVIGFVVGYYVDDGK